VFVEVREVLTSVKDAPSSEAAVGRLKELNERLIDIQRRSLSAPTTTMEELQEIAKQTNRQADADAAGKELKRIAVGNLATRELADEMSKFTRLLSGAGHAAFAGLMMPDPQNEYDKIEWEHVEIIRRVTAAILGANDVASLDQAAGVYEEGTRQLKVLAERRERAGGSIREIAKAMNRYSMPRSGVSRGTLDHTFSLAERGILSVALHRAESEFWAAEHELTDDMKFGMLAQAKAAGPLAPLAAAGLEEAHIRILVTRDDRPDPVMQLPGAHTDEQWNKAIAEKRARGEQHALAQTEAAKRLVTLLGVNYKRAEYIGPSGEVRFPYSGNLQELAKKIDFASVDSVDEGKRTIQITVNRELATKP
jgi:hypothetical protein